MAEAEQDSEFPFDESLFAPQNTAKPRKTRAQRRACRKKGVESPVVTRDMLIRAQQEDPQIQEWNSKAGDEERVTEDGVLFRRAKGDQVELVLPEPHRPKVLHLAHDIPLAGHMGRERTLARLHGRFWWPGMAKDVAEYCRTCGVCQKTSRRGQKAPLVPMPVIGEPFERIAMDIIGPLPRTRTGKRFVLVVSDYATRYPEAYPLNNGTAESVAEKLVEMFCQYGIPKEIISDQGANFMSELLKELYAMLGVCPIRTSPYHPQTDGLVERYNQTLKSMLRRVLMSDKDRRSWDKLLPLVMFAYREVPQASTGFSPFELVYGRDVRGPLDLLREEWTLKHGQETIEDVATYLTRLHERMQLAFEEVRKHMDQSQRRQKKWYDAKARELQLTAGDQVLLLLPDSTQKFYRRWQGPYTVTKVLGKVNYEVKMEDGRCKVFHINLLKKWFPRLATEEAYQNVSVGQVMVEGQTVRVGDGLTEKQRESLQGVMTKFPRVLRKEPGHTHLIEHHIPITNSQPIRQRPYRIPHAFREEVLKELTTMEKFGIIEVSDSPWASPIVVVRKKNNKPRICVDYRKLNQLTKADAYPMPRIEDLLDSVGQSRYISTIDLAKGYWQVPVAPEDRPKTAFTTPKGLFQFTTMLFGLTGAPATFQRLMDKVLRGTEQQVGVYLDDILIHSQTWEDHLRHIADVLSRLDQAGLTINLQKCTFRANQCEYLGHRIGGGGISPMEDKVRAIQAIKQPRTKKEVRAFLGLTGYYR